MKNYYILLLVLVWVHSDLSAGHGGLSVGHGAGIGGHGAGIARRQAPASSGLLLSPLFSDNMVLQQGIPIRIWGAGSPGERVLVSLGGRQVGVAVRPDGRWMAELPARAYGGPFVLRVRGLHHEILDRSNVMIGEVWLASGQSNMNFSIGRPVRDMEKVVAGADEPMIREFNVPVRVSKEPLKDLNGGSWLVCNRQNVSQFSAVAYFFARALYAKKKCAIGIIHSSRGGTAIETWISREALLTHPAFTDKVLQSIKDTMDWAARQRISDSTDSVRSVVIGRAHNGLDLGVEQPGYIDTGWKACTYPIRAGNIRAPAYGFIWFRKTIEIPAGAAGKDHTLYLGKLLESDITYFNGTEIGRSHQLDTTQYNVPARLIRPGKNVIAIRLLSQWGSGQVGSPEDRAVLFGRDGAPGTGRDGTEPVSGEGTMSIGREGTASIALTGTWLFNTGIEPQLAVGNSLSGMFSAQYNGMINPLVSYGIKGILWYQGEGNAGRYKEYRTLQPLLIGDWRHRWQKGSLPFLFVQLPNLSGAADWPWMREAQAQSLSVPSTGMAVTIDIGDRYDVHPHNKQPVGERLALLARSTAYHESVVSAGPVLTMAVPEGSRVLMHFTNTGGGLVFRGNDSLSGFMIAGKDRVFHRAVVVVKDKELIVSSPLVDLPVSVRYAWEADPPATLFNREGLPAGPFRTDDWID